MRIAYLVNEYPAVSHTFIRREIHALERLGFEVARIAVRGWAGELVDQEDLQERKRTRYVLRRGAFRLLFGMTCTALTRPRAMLNALALAWRMSRGAERPLHIHLIYLAEACCILPWLRGISHVHAHFGTNTAEVAMLAHVLGGPPWSFTSHGPEEYDKALIIGLAEKIRRCAFVVAISAFGRSQLYRHTSREHWAKVREVHCGVDPAFHRAPPQPVPTARRLVCVGRLSIDKAQLLLVQAIARLAARVSDFELVLAGDGPLRSDVETLIASHHLQGKVRITGWIAGAQVREEILASRALVLPSFAEGLPVVIMEAMALRRPVITTYIAGIPELVIPGESGWLVPASDIDALVQAMQACLDASPATLEKMGEAARVRALARHDVDTEAAKLAAMFRDEAGRAR